MHHHHHHHYAFYNTHVKLLAFDLLFITQISSDPIFFSRYGTLLSRAETLGVVTSLDLKLDKFLKFIIDDDTGYVDCVLWLNHLTSPCFERQSPSDVRQIAASMNHFAYEVKLSTIVKVRG